MIDPLWARWCARRVLHLWEAPAVVVAWIDTGDPAIREAAARAAWVAWAAVTTAAAARAAWVAWAAAAELAAEARASWAAAAAALAGWAAGAEEEASEIDAQTEALAYLQSLPSLTGSASEALTTLRRLAYDLPEDDPIDRRWLLRELWRETHRGTELEAVGVGYLTPRVD